MIFDKYRLIEKLGEGGMGEVWLVHNRVLDCNRALKLIRPEIAKNDSGWKRFKREARLMAKLNHPNAVAVYDFKRLQSMGYIEMEYVRGRSLDKILEERKGQPMPLEWIVQDPRPALLACSRRRTATSTRTPASPSRSSTATSSRRT